MHQSRWMRTATRWIDLSTRNILVVQIILFTSRGGGPPETLWVRRVPPVLFHDGRRGSSNYWATVPPASIPPQNSCRLVVPQPVPLHTPVIWNWSPNQKWMMSKPFCEGVWQMTAVSTFPGSLVLSCRPCASSIPSRTWFALSFNGGAAHFATWPSGWWWVAKGKTRKASLLGSLRTQCRTAWKPWTRQICGLGMVGGKASGLCRRWRVCLLAHVGQVEELLADSDMISKAQEMDRVWGFSARRP